MLHSTWEILFVDPRWQAGGITQVWFLFSQWGCFLVTFCLRSDAVLLTFLKLNETVVTSRLAQVGNQSTFLSIHLCPIQTWGGLYSAKVSKIRNLVRAPVFHCHGQWAMGFLLQCIEMCHFWHRFVVICHDWCPKMYLISPASSCSVIPAGIQFKPLPIPYISNRHKWRETWSTVFERTGKQR